MITILFDHYHFNWQNLACQSRATSFQVVNCFVEYKEKKKTFARIALL